MEPSTYVKALSSQVIVHQFVVQQVIILQVDVPQGCYTTKTRKGPILAPNPSMASESPELNLKTQSSEYK
jgi:hypothetical protein